MKNNGTLFVVSAPSGCGKDTVLKLLMEKQPELRFSKSCITRPERSPEDREKYYMISRERFEQMINGNELLEYNEYNGNYYGTPKKPVEDWLNGGYNVILEIDINGARNVKRMMPEAVSLFILPPSFAALEERLRSRGTESDENIRNRLKIAADEIKASVEYDYVCVNDDLYACVDDIAAIIKAQAFSQNNMKKFIKEVENDAESFNR